MFARHGTIQEKINTFYESNPVQCFIAILIFANFILNAAQSELNPDDGDLYPTIICAVQSGCVSMHMNNLG
jgi:hypothetical protein